LDPPPPWTAADHHEPDLWPTVDDHDVDLNAIVGPTWVDETGRRVRERLLDVQGEPMIGHGDWYTGNLRWVANRLLSVWDWDSIIVATEPVIAGLAAAVYPVTSAGHESTIEESEQFLRAYADARGRTFSKDDLEVAWAAGLWNRVFDAKKQYAVEGSIKSLDENEARDRLGRAGLLSGSGS
jgi:aminoglycoside phosphotransferase (APT) family kinase protein